MISIFCNVVKKIVTVLTKLSTKTQVTQMSYLGF